MSIKYDKYEFVDPPAAWLTEQLRRRYNTPEPSVPKPSGEATPTGRWRDFREDTIAALKTEITELRDELSKEKELSDQLFEKVTELQDACVSNQKSAVTFMKRYQNQIKEQKSEIANLQSIVEQQNAEIERLKEQLVEASKPKRKRPPIGKSNV